ncbi:MAG: tRNA pseudouridine(13) synthase TruD, partial [Marinobacter sp.]|nr:tRNA pseudouridine(13) synthase TruD [Marinobacter sp.]
MSQWRLDWPTSGGGRVALGRLKTSPGDFVVDEILELPDGYSDADAEPVAGGGEHLCLKL